MERWYNVFATELGWVGILASSRGLRRTTLPKGSPQEALEGLGPEMEGAQQDPERLGEVHARLQAYYRGQAVGFQDIPLDLEGTPPFFRAAWRVCQSIPSGETRSYGWLAEKAKRPAASRAAGQAMARNRLPPIIPCHRVIGSDGGLHGYGGGLGLKQRLLDMEGAP